MSTTCGLKETWISSYLNWCGSVCGADMLGPPVLHRGHHLQLGRQGAIVSAAGLWGRCVGSARAAHCPPPAHSQHMQARGSSGPAVVAAGGMPRPTCASPPCQSLGPARWCKCTATKAHHDPVMLAAVALRTTSKQGARYTRTMILSSWLPLLEEKLSPVQITIETHTCHAAAP